MAWYDEMVKEFKELEVPEDSVTATEFSRKISKSKTSAREILKAKVEGGELKRVWSGGEYHYYA